MGENRGRDKQLLKGGKTFVCLSGPGTKFVNVMAVEVRQVRGAVVSDKSKVKMSKHQKSL